MLKHTVSWFWGKSTTKWGSPSTAGQGDMKASHPGEHAYSWATHRVLYLGLSSLPRSRYYKQAPENPPGLVLAHLRVQTSPTPAPISTFPHPLPDVLEILILGSFTFLKSGSGRRCKRADMRIERLWWYRWVRPKFYQASQSLSYRGLLAFLGPSQGTIHLRRCSSGRPKP